MSLEVIESRRSLAKSFFPIQRKRRRHLHAGDNQSRNLRHVSARERNLADESATEFWTSRCSYARRDIRRVRHDRLDSPCRFVQLDNAHLLRECNRERRSWDWHCSCRSAGQRFNGRGPLELARTIQPQTTRAAVTGCGPFL